MRGIRRFLSIANKTLAVVAGIGLVQMLTIASSFSQSSNPRSLDELYKIRDRLVTELEQPDNPSPEPTLLSRLVPPAANPQEKLLSQLQAVEAQILVEQRAKDDLQQAVRLANRAVETKRQQNQSIESSQQTQFLWNQALNNLQSVPQDSFLASLTASKTQEYRENLTQQPLKCSKPNQIFWLLLPGKAVCLGKLRSAFAAFLENAYTCGAMCLLSVQPA